MYVHDTADVPSLDPGTAARESASDSREHINVRAWESVRAGAEMRSAIVSVDHAPTVMVLTKQCAGVSNLTCHMRINDHLLDHDLLVALDGQLRASVRASLRPPQASPAADRAYARCLGPRSPPSLPPSLRLLLLAASSLGALGASARPTGKSRDAPLAPLRHGDANGTSTVGAADATSSVRCGGSPCSNAVMTTTSDDGKHDTENDALPVAVLARAISCSSVRMIFLRHELFCF